MTISMKKIILACLLATSAASAFAEWTKVSESYDTNFYIDFQAIRKDSGLSNVWVIHDLKQRQQGIMSMRARYEFDCGAEKIRTLFLSAHSEPMVGGKTLVSGSPNGTGTDIPPGTPFETILKIVCAK